MSEADDSAGEGGEGEVKVGAALVSDAEATEAGKPGEAALHHTPVLSEMSAAVHAVPCDPGLDPG